ncbi:MAG: hypothetical protein M0D54_08175 [Hyphomonadaceae bacterium JAD_PAG50586_4]|nr:MAG: hypothetical protein M0D54_08175 [Hyphomonadaceae bacterium JAD_PAG50586_4]
MTVEILDVVLANTRHHVVGITAPDDVVRHFTKPSHDEAIMRVIKCIDELLHRLGVGMMIGDEAFSARHNLDLPASRLSPAISLIHSSRDAD